ncbi:MAG: Flp pilus assembly protein CpaB [Kiloniellales bacterium]
MTFRSIMLIAAALLMAVGTVLVARGWIESQRSQPTAAPAPAPTKAPFVLVAGRDLPLGSFIKQGQLRWQAWPDDSLPDNYLVKGKVKEEDLYGTVVRRSFTPGEPITQDRLIRPGDRGFLAAVLQAGFRAVSIQIGASSGIAGLLFPGDRVDIILTQTLELRPAEEENKRSIERRASETVLTNVRILALDQKVDDQSGQPKLAKTATLEVTPKQAEILAVVRELGSLSLALRSIVKDEEELERLVELQQLPEETDPEKGATYTWDSEASLLVSGHQTNERKTVVTIARGKETQQMSFGSSQ